MKIIIIVEEDLMEIARHIRGLRVTHTPDQRRIFLQNFMRSKNNPLKNRSGDMPSYLEAVFDSESVRNLCEHREFWEAAGSKYHSLNSQDFIDLRAGTIRYYQMATAS